MVDMEWNGTSLQIFNNDRNQELIQSLMDKNIGEPDGDYYIVYNNKNLWFFEQEYIKEQTKFKEIIDKLSQKNYTDDLEYYESGNFECLNMNMNTYKRESEIYKQIISENNIDGIERKKLNISINILSQTNKNGDKEQKYVETIYILIFLAHKTMRIGNEFNFYFNSEHRNFQIDLNFTKKVEYDLFNMYEWIVKENDYQESFKIKLDIVREIIFRKQSIKESESILTEAKSVFKRIISQETKEYFEQANQLRRDFLTLSSDQNKANRTLHISLFGWLGYIGLTILDFIKEYEGQYLINSIVFLYSEKVIIIILLLIGTLIVIMSAYVKEVYDNKKTYKELRVMYIEKFNFTEQDFDKYMKEPKVNKVYCIIAVGIVIALFFRLTAKTG